MTTRSNPISVGSPDPTLKTSPVVEESNEDFDVIVQEFEGSEVCYFNGVTYNNDTYVCSGSGELLHCENGMWIQEGGCDSDNP